MMCPLCHNSGAELFHRDNTREFFLCPACTIIFVPRSSLLSSDEEKKRYDSHQNDETDPGYRDYFLKTVGPVMRNIQKGARGLDFGCGRTRLMEKLFREKGTEVDSFDPFYFPDPDLWSKKYDFAVLNEVIEHLADPAATLQKLKSIIDGPLFVRTKLYPANEPEFSRWFYKRDVTHVQFFSMKAFMHLGSVEMLDEDLYKIELK